MKLRRSLIAILCAVLWTSFAVATSPAADPRPVTPDDALALRAVSGVSLSPDARHAAVVVGAADMDANEMRSDLHLVETATGSSFQLTNAAVANNSPQWSPDGKWLAFLSNRPNRPEKAGRWQIWLISPSGGEARQLTRGRYNVNSLAWSPDGSRIAFRATELDTEEMEKRKREKDDAVQVDSDHRMSRIFLVEVATGETELLYGERHVTSISYSPDRKHIAFAEQPTPKVPDGFYSEVKVLDVQTKSVRHLAGGQTSAGQPAWSPDGKHIAFVSGQQRDWVANNYLYVVPAEGGEARRVSGEFDERMGQFEWAADSQSLYFVGPRRADQGIFQVTLDGKLTLLEGRRGVARDISVAAGHIAYVYENPLEPPDLHFAALNPPAAAPRGRRSAPASTFTPKKLTDFNPQTRELALGQTGTVTWKNSEDGFEAEGLLVTPPGHRPGTALPLLVIIHGGPAGVFSNSFTLRRGVYPVQVFASQGYAVFLPNPRGSGGFGEAYRKANVRDWGYGDYRDIEDGVDMLVATGVADKDRMGVMGWSYGGYMTSWVITRTARYRAASVGAGVTNLFSMWGTTDIPPFLESYFGARPWEDRDLMAKHSAMYHLDRVKTPTLIQHGTEDRRVPLAQGEELYTGLRSLGVPTEMIKYPRTPHGISEPRLIRDGMMRNLEWFDRYVKGNAAAAAWHQPASRTSPQAAPGGR